MFIRTTLFVAAAPLGWLSLAGVTSLLRNIISSSLPAPQSMHPLMVSPSVETRLLDQVLTASNSHLERIWLWSAMSLSRVPGMRFFSNLRAFVP